MTNSSATCQGAGKNAKGWLGTATNCISIRRAGLTLAPLHEEPGRDPAGDDDCLVFDEHPGSTRQADVLATFLNPRRGKELKEKATRGRALSDPTASARLRDASGDTRGSPAIPNADIGIRDVMPTT